jgi:apoptosis-inducing factor 3
MSAESIQPAGVDLEAVGCSVGDLPDGTMLVGTVRGETVLIARQGNEYFAVSATCSHYGGPLAEGILVGDTVRCPWHHACFSLRTGEALRAPALNPIACWTTERRGSQVFVTGKKAERDPLAPAQAVVSQPSEPASVVIIGAGAAGSAAAEMLRRQGYTRPITMVDIEADAPYDRPNLSKDYLAGTALAEWIPLRPAGFYMEHGIDIVRSRATSIDPRASRVTLANGQVLQYGALLLATGSDPIRLDIPGADLPFVHVLRSLDDSRAIIAATATARRAVVIGGSFVGLEVAASLRHRGIDVDVVGIEAAPLERVLGDTVGNSIRRMHESHGVVFHMSTTTMQIDDMDGVQLKDGTQLPADLVVVGIGVRPRVDLARQAGLHVDGGVLVDSHLETSVPGIYAAGDIARWPDPHAGERIRVEHWVVAQRQGQTAARNILGASEIFDAVPYFWSAHYDVTLRYVGHAKDWDRVASTGSLGSGHASVAYRGHEKTLAVASIGEDRQNLEAEVALERGDQQELVRLIPEAASGVARDGQPNRPTAPGPG